jgi:ABC-type transport system substrate-binding protein
MKGDAAEAAGAAGDLDLAVRLNPADASIVQKATNLDTILSPGVGTYGPQFNLTDASGVNNPDKARCDTECRRAVSYGIDAPGIVANIFGGLGVVNRGVNPGMPAADDQEFFDYSTDKCKEHLAKSTWDKSKPLRIIFDNSFAGVLQWTPVMQQNLQACGFNVDLKGMESSAAIAAYNDPLGYEILIMQGGDQGVGPFHQQPYYNCKQENPAVWKWSYPRDCRIDDLFAQARLEPDPAKQQTIFKQISSITNKLIDKTSLWTTQALSFKSKCLVGPTVPKNTRFFINTVKDWYFTC